MRVAALPESFYRAAGRQPVELSRQAAQRLCDCASGGSCVRAGSRPPKPPRSWSCLAPPSTGWTGSTAQTGPVGSNPARCPHRRRLPTWSAGLVEAVRQQRESPPCYGKDKIAVILRR